MDLAHRESVSVAELVAVTVLEKAQVGYRLHEHQPVMGTADHAKSGLELKYAAKTLAFMIAETEFALVTLPASARLSYGVLARTLGVPRAQLKPVPPESLPGLGMRLGGVCPFTTDPAVKVVLDAGLMSYPFIYCGSGDPRVTVEITWSELRRALPDAIIANITS
jgi:prolyl-tRNA editing enzyme YbaK/EbsC (Cys-tRNA(Pro) deacylase)